MTDFKGYDVGPKPKIICLCGSTRFIEHFAIMAWELEKQGNIVVGCHYLPPSYFKDRPVVGDHLAEVEECKEDLDRLHFRKIELADEIFVLNVGGYVGDSTKREIAYARSLGKKVRWLEQN
ncbi:unnamed protein product [marine sediment metagenome]|uniref:DUF2493 domain-containing protein n=1 Tax=marine sediment metagenome TaxID=412755 RepID=X1V5R4_9ZZZZ